MILLFTVALAMSPTGLASAPKPNQPLARLVSPADYPWKALAAREQGSVVILLLVSEIGRVADCRITASSGSAVLDSASCIIIKRRARFHPAVDADGNRVAGEYEHLIEWVLP